MQKRILLPCLLAFFLLSGNKLFSQLKANFSSDISSGCAPIIVKFSDQSTGNPASWKWDLGNGTISNLQHPSATYFLPGIYTVKLVVKSGSQQDSVTKTAFINVLQQPTVNFKSDITTGCNPLTINFTDQSSGSVAISLLQWDFGDGTLSTEKNPSHTYTLPGSYSVTLKATNAKGCAAAEKKQNYIKNYGAVAAFTAGASAFCRPDKIVFNNTSSSKDSFICHWDFGDSTYSSAFNPIHTYLKGGNYTVKLTITSVFGCESSMVKNVAVQNSVSAFFEADKLYNCNYPVTVNFTNAELPGNSYTWEFGDLTKSGLSKPAHIYADSGTFDVKLIVKNTNGCVDSFTRKSYITIQRSSFGFLNLPDSGCKGLTKKIELVSNPRDSITSYSWQLGDGTVSSLASPENTYSTIGTYDVSVIITSAKGCVDTLTMNKAIQIGDKPKAKLSVDTTIQCANKRIDFNNLSENSTSWLWDFGNNTTSVEQFPSYTYQDTGWVSVTLIAINSGCADTATYNDYIYLKPAVSNFLATMNCLTPFKRQFKNMSIAASQYLWDFGDGTTSTALAPSHIFPATGIYTVKLWAKNDSTGCSYTTSHAIKIIKAAPSFFASDSMPCRGGSIDFTAIAEEADIARYTWDFGDGATLSTIKTTISHVYNKPGVYTVSLVTLNIMNCRDTLIKKGYITVNGPVAKFGVSAFNPCVNNEVTFLDSSIAGAGNPIIKWTWKYGDGKTESFTNSTATHTYITGGSFTPSLTLTDSRGCSDSVNLSRAIAVVKIAPNFSISAPVVCPGYAVKFTCPYNTKGITYKWDFGDSSTSSLQVPSHTYVNEGTYTIKLHITVYGCEADYVITNGVTVKQTVANFAMSDSFKMCPPLLINFTDSSVNAVSWHWDFGDSSYADIKNPSHLYTYPGKYTATLYSKGPAGCVKTMQKTVTVKGPTGIMTFTPLKQCRPYNTSFQVQSKDAVSYVWDFNDGSTNDTSDSLVTHNYQDSGTFFPKIILVDDAGCRVPVSSKDSLVNLYVKPDFIFSDSLLCDKGTMPFLNTTSSNDVIKSYLWNFGDNISSSQKNPSHLYNAPGEYFPELIVTTAGGCTNQYKSPLPVKVGTSPHADMAPPVSGCLPLNASFKGVETAANAGPLQWKWDFGNGNNDDLQQPPVQTYTVSGDYNVRLSVFGPDGCYKTITKVITAYPLPLLNKTSDTVICRDGIVKLHASGASYYKWSPSNAVVCDSCATTVANAELATRFYLTGTSSRGCVSRDSVKVTIKPRPVLTYGGENKLCRGKSTQLTAGGTESYQWSPAAGLNNAATSSPVATPDSTTNYQVIGYDNMGCYKDTGYVKVTVFPQPTVDAGADKKINVGLPTELTATVSNDVNRINWSPTDGSFRYDNATITVKPQQNTEYTVEVKNRDGCTAKDKVTVFVLCDGTNVFIPNAFSPNGDGVNDVFYLRGTGLYKIKSLVIFDRWGQPIFQKKSFDSNDISVGWDGTYKGNKVNADVYVYSVEIICNNTTVLSYNGNVALIR